MIHVTGIGALLMIVGALFSAMAQNTPWSIFFGRGMIVMTMYLLKEQK